MNTALMFSRASDEWSTPNELFDALHAEFDFGLDAAATPQNAKCTRWLSTDALELPWEYYSHQQAIWLNPPYSQCRAFMAKAAREAALGSVVVCLVPARTDTRWWHEHVWAGSGPRPGVEVRFLKGRLKFGGCENSAPFPSVVIIFRPTS